MKFPQKYGRRHTAPTLQCRIQPKHKTEMDKRMGDFGLAKNYRYITLTSLVAKFYNALQGSRIESKIEKTFSKNQNGCEKKSIHDVTYFDYPSNSGRCTCKKNLQATTLFVDFSKAFDSIHRGKMEQILLGNPKKLSQP